MDTGVVKQCEARTGREGGVACVSCRLSWDRDDTPPPCPYLALEAPLQPTEYVSALAPDLFSTFQR